MIKAKHNKIVDAFFQHYATTNIKKHFQEVVIAGDIEVEGHAVLLLSNHISWWDGFCALYLNMHILKKRFHFMMDETELKKRWLFSYSGGFSIGGSSRSKFDSIQYASSLLEDPDNMVLIYPQGKLYSSHSEYIHFQKGIEHIRRTAEHPSKVIFLVQLTDYYQHKKPSLYLYLGEANTANYPGKNFEEQYNAFYKKCLAQHCQQIV